MDRGALVCLREPPAQLRPARATGILDPPETVGRRKRTKPPLCSLGWARKRLAAHSRPRPDPRELIVALTPTPQLIFEISTVGRPPYRVTLRKAQNIVGRESGEIVLHDPEASALHAEIGNTAGHVIVRDLGSSNGTWRNDTRLPQFALYEGQSFRCGNSMLRLIAIEGVAAPLKPGQTAVGGTAPTVETLGTPPHKTLLGSPHAASAPLSPPPGWSPPPDDPPDAPPLGKPAPIAAAPRHAPDGSTATLRGPEPRYPSSAPTVPGGGSSTPTVPGLGLNPPPTTETVPGVALPPVPGSGSNPAMTSARNKTALGIATAHPPGPRPAGPPSTATVPGLGGAPPEPATATVSGVAPPPAGSPPSPPASSTQTVPDAAPRSTGTVLGSTSLQPPPSPPRAQPGPGTRSTGTLRGVAPESPAAPRPADPGARPESSSGPDPVPAESRSPLERSPGPAKPGVASPLDGLPDPAEPGGAPGIDPPRESDAPDGAARFAPPVANAVIKDAVPAGRARPVSTPRVAKRSRWPRLLAYASVSALGVGAVVGVAYVLWSMWSGRGLAFVQEVASELPESTLGVAAVASPADAVALIGDDVPPQLRTQAIEAFSFDPLDVEAWSEMGIDPDAPVGLALLDWEPIYALSIGVHDRSAFREALTDTLPRFVRPAEAALSWTERDFSERSGWWLEEPPIAVVHLDERSVVVFSPGEAAAEDIAKQARAVAETEDGKSLADRDAFAEIVAPPGTTLSMLYVDAASVRNALPGGGLSMLAIRTGLADLDGMVVALSHQGSDVHLTSETIVREGSRHLELLQGAREGQALTRLQAPVLASFDSHFDADTFDRTVGGAASMVGASLSVVEQEFSESVGIDLRADITQNLSGEFGAALLKLPSDLDAVDMAAVAWVGVANESKAQQDAQRVFAKHFSDPEAGVSSHRVGDAVVYTKDADPERHDPRVQAFVAAGQFWFAIGEVDAQSIIEGPDARFLDAPRHPSIATAMKTGNDLGAFIDLHELLPAVQTMVREPETEQLESYQELTELLEVLSLRSRVQGRTIVVQASLHTNVDDGLSSLVRVSARRAAAVFTESLADASRKSRCAALSEHIGTLSRAALDKAGASSDTGWAAQRRALQECERPRMTDARYDCYMATESWQDLAVCDTKHPAGVPAAGTTETSGGPSSSQTAEPKTVPYVEDIWPYLGDDPDSETPQPEVNYAVPVGPSAYARGAVDPLVTIVMFGDFECPHCAAVNGTLDEVLAQHGETVRLVFRNLPLDRSHPMARPAAKAALAAGAQGKFWEMHDQLYSNQSRLSEDVIDNIASDLGLDMKRFATDVASAQVDRRLQRDAEVAAKFGVKGTPSFFVNGRYLGGRRTKSAFNTLIAEEKRRATTFVERRGDTRKRLYEDMITHFAAEVLQPSVALEVPDPDAKRYSVNTDGLPKKGASSFAQVQIIECGDFDCPYCASARKSLDEVVDAYPTQVAIYFAHNPLTFHRSAEPAARAAVAAAQQDKFWEMHDELFKEQSGRDRTEADYVRYATRLGLDVKRFKTDLAAPKTAEIVESQRKSCTSNDATATPTFFINGRRVTGAKSFDQFKALIETELSTGI